MKRVIIHIGAAKCGSSAIQTFMATNKQYLAENGILVPSGNLDLEGPWRGEQIELFEKVHGSADGLATLKQKMAGLKAHMDEHNFHTVIISAENISNHSGLAKHLKEAVEGFDPLVVYYVRRQDDYLISSWQQWHLKTQESMEYFLSVVPEAMFDWYDNSLPWVESFGDAHFKGRAFRQDKLVNGDVIDDFFATIGINLPQLAQLKPTELENRSLSEHLGDMGHRARDVFENEHDNLFYFTMAQLIGEPAHKQGSASHIMSLEERLAIYKKYEKSNADFKARFLPDSGDGPLFDPPAEKNVRAISEIDKLRGEIDLLTRAVYRLALKNT